ncbi:hypothetical protein ACJROX_10870 [Pseudalkalibacillus sp. A8]|uniref:hypothetical protein n=1 Tax=Pseudalkalibacillus sp. A8 TaxID=3382641 RepID=UPI0038B61E8B
MKQLQRDILYWLRESRKERGMSVSQIANKVKRDVGKIEVELAVLAENNLIEVTGPRGKIKRAIIKPEGENYFKEETTIVTKESVKEQINELKSQILSLEMELEKLQENPTEENKRTFLEKLDSLQSVANGFTPLVKAGLELFK